MFPHHQPVSFTSPAIIFINQDLTPSIISTFTNQLYLTSVIDKATFDANVAADGYAYPESILSSGQRVMVLLDYTDGYNREFASVALFAKNGAVSTLCNKFGPPQKSLPIDDITLPLLFRFCPRSCCPCCERSFFCNIFCLFPGADCCRYIFPFDQIIPSPFVSPIPKPTRGF
jgi:hypothetical protein